MKYDFLIVGAGYAGCILANRIASELGKKCLIVDKRMHIGGNSYDYFDSEGLLIHKYGPHIFHTNSKKVWDFLSRFTSWHEYYHHVLALVDGKKVPVPFNLNSIEKCFPKNYAEQLSSALIEKYGYGLKIPILKLQETDNPDLKFLSEYIYKNVFLGYTLKQWGKTPEELDFSVSSRVPVFISRDDRYFQDTYQGIPSKGYAAMMQNMLNHPNIQLMLNTDYKNISDWVKFDKMIYTGPIDYFFDYSHGKLPYRSLEFDFQTLDMEHYQETAQVNYPNNHDYTRITEFKHFLTKRSEKTTIAFEYPCDYVEGTNDPYYPIQTAETDALLEKYKNEVAKLARNVFFVGRLAEYKYYNMDQVAASALMMFEKQIAAGN